MPVDLSLEIDGLEEVQTKFAHAPQIVEEETIRSVSRSTKRLTPAVQEKTPVDTNRLRGDIGDEVRKETGYIIGRVYIMGGDGRVQLYGTVMERGARPHFPPLSALEPWARRHGMTAWQVAISIARKGIKPRRMFERAFKENLSWLQGEFKDLGKRIARRLGGS